MADKSIILVKRKGGLDRAAFRQHYEDVHEPLALQWFGFDKYVRNHVDLDGADFDCLAEFWPHDPAQIARAAEAGAAIFAEDDARFMSQARRGAAVDELHLAGPARETDPPGTRKTIYVVSGAPGDLAAWAAAQVACGSALRITADRPRGGGGNLGDVTIVHLWRSAASAVEPALPPGLAEQADVEVCETPAKRLRDSREALQS